MKLEIKSKDDFVIEPDFVYWLKGIVSKVIKSSVRYQKLIVWDKYLTEADFLTLTNRKSITAREIVLCGADNLVVQILPDKFIIHIDNKKKINGVSAPKLEQLCRLINFGNSDIKGYPIFTDSFTSVINNIDNYIELYYLQKARRTP